MHILIWIPSNLAIYIYNKIHLKKGIVAMNLYWNNPCEGFKQDWVGKN